MNYGKAIYEILSLDGDLVTLLDGEKKIYPVEIPQETELPAVVYTKISQTPSHTKSSTSMMDVVRVQIDTFSHSYSEMEEIDERVRYMLDYFRGLVNGVAIDSIHFITSTEVLDDELNVKHTATDYNIRINRDGVLSNVGDPIPGADRFIKQIETNQTGTDIIVTVGTLPTANIKDELNIYRGGRLMIITEDFTIEANNTIRFNIPLLSENVIIDLKVS